MRIVILLLTGLCLALAASAQENPVSYLDIIHLRPLRKCPTIIFSIKSDLFLLFISNGNLLKEADVDSARARLYPHLSTIGTEKARSVRSTRS